MRFTLGRKIAAGFASILLLMIGSAFLVYSKSVQIKNLERQSLTVVSPSFQLSTALQRDLNQTQSKGREAALAGSNSERSQVAWGRYKEAWDAVDDDIARMSEFSKKWVIKENLARLADIQAALPALRQNQESFMKLAASSRKDAVTQAGNQFADVCSKNTAVIKKSLDAMASAQKTLIDDTWNNLEALQASLLKMQILAAIAAIVAGSLIAIWVSRVISSASFRVLARAGAISKGDLSGAPLVIATSDELGELSEAINEMQKSLRQMIASVSTSAERIATAGEELSATSAQQAQGAETQKNQTQQVAVAMQEMSATVQEVSENSNRAAEASRNAAEIARQGGAIVDDTLKKMRAIADSVGQTATLVQELGDSSSQIGKIIGVIENIANQTNLLAFNAAIEAARAGEQGRGFAVVADEVRKLAVSTTNATQEITLMIQKIQTGTKRAVEAMQLGTEQVELGVESTTQAGGSLNEIIKTSGQVGDMVMLIATAATQQASASEEINSNVEQIAKITEETSNAANEAAKAIAELATLATDLQTLVSRFKVDDGAKVGRNTTPRARDLEEIVSQKSQRDREFVEVH
ncbi:MAG TPA: methyl-accepting chemotaxis protein [Candidatus Acidoferrales bacterium]|nr:methyl-accepting chemotaxis protein [Candidatus Acidoferrales bacterium]